MRTLRRHQERKELTRIAKNESLRNLREAVSVTIRMEPVPPTESDPNAPFRREEFSSLIASLNSPEGSYLPKHLKQLLRGREDKNSTLRESYLSTPGNDYLSESIKKIEAEYDELSEKSSQDVQPLLRPKKKPALLARSKKKLTYIADQMKRYQPHVKKAAESTTRKLD
jgi:hypothetical protein